MKKHISDQPPTLASMGVSGPPELERAIMHTLEKKPERRTPSVDVFIAEMLQALYPGSSIHSTAGRTLPVSSLKIQSKPPNSSVYIDNVAVGETAPDNGTLLLEGIQSGNHHLRLSHDGFYDWQGDVVCDGRPQEVYAELRSGVAGATDSNVAIPMPTDAGMPIPGNATVANRNVLNSQDAMAQTVQQTWRPDSAVVSVGSGEKKKGFFSPVVLGITAVLGLLLIGVIGGGAAYMLGFLGGGKGVGPATTPTPASTPIFEFKADLATIPGGSFQMGRDEGRDNEKPAHTVDVSSFRMDKNEVTNAEYFSFVTATSYRPVPADWVNEKPIPGTERMPVRFVNIDDINAFIGFRSKRDGINYRLPTEAEWEYAARNGAKDNLYPWGDDYRAQCAVMDQDNTEPEISGSHSCPNEWGVVDLIGNVYEWTGTKANLYPGSSGKMLSTKEQRNMIRGGGAFSKSNGEFGITSTFRADVETTKRDKELGFRLVAPM
jgi:formylglycine-generating enzyme required for sulfatase activity